MNHLLTPVRRAPWYQFVAGPALLLLLTLTATVPMNARAGDHRLVTVPVPQSNGDAGTGPRVDFTSVPRSFEVNTGQTDARVKYLARGQGYTLFLTSDEAVLSLATTPPARPSRGDRRPAADREQRSAMAASESLRLKFEGAQSNTLVVAERELPGEVNYLVGSDSAKWRQNVSTYTAVRYESLYAGIDAVFYGTRQQLEYDFVVEPNADPSQIRIRIDGARRIDVDEAGDLVLELTNGEIRQQRATVFQKTAAGQRAIGARYSVDAGGEIRFDVAEYDRSQPLVIDPVLVYSTWLGGASSADACNAAALDATGNLYVTGGTAALDFPTTSGAYDATFNGGRGDAFVSKISADGATVLYSTVVGGSGFQDGGTAIAVDASGAAYVTGVTSSADFPTTPNAYDRTHGSDQGDDAFVLKLAPDGSALDFSTYVGGEVCVGRGIAVVGGTVYVTGTTETANHVTTPGAYDRTFDGQELDQEGFVAALSANGTALIYSTFLGGAGRGEARAMAVDSAGAVFVTGYTMTPNFGTTAGAFDTHFDGVVGAFVLKLAPGGAALAYSTLLGGASGTYGWDVTVDGSGAAYVVGMTGSPDFPTTDGAFDRTYNGGQFGGDGFVSKVSPSGASLVYSTFLGAAGSEDCFAIELDSSGSAYVAGSTTSAAFPVTAGAFDTAFGDSLYGTGFVTKLSPSGGSLLYSSFLGGGRYDYANDLVVDAAGAAYVVGHTESLDFPVVGAPLVPPDRNAGFIAKVAPTGAALVFSKTFGGSITPETGLPDTATALAVGEDGSTYLAGWTQSVNFPTTPGTYDPVFDENPPGDDLDAQAFVSKLGADGSSLVYSTFLGGVRDDRVYGLVVDGSGAAYLGGATMSPDFPTTSGAYDTSFDALADGFVLKLSADGSSLLFSTMLGAENYDQVTSVELGPSGGIYVTGSTSSLGFPTTAGAYDTTPNDSGDVFVTKLSTDGASLLRSTILGGSHSDVGASVALDAAGNVYVAGSTSSDDLPVTSQAVQAHYGGGFVDGFVTRLNADLGSLVYSTYLGGGQSEAATGLHVDAQGAAFVVGSTASADFPVTPGALDTTHNGGGFYGDDIFVTRLAPDGSLQYSTFVGGVDDDDASAVTGTADGVAYVCGSSASEDFPTTSGALPMSVVGNAVVFALNPDGSSLRYSTLFGGNSVDEAQAIVVDAQNAVYVAGYTWSSDFPSSGVGLRDGWQAFLAKIAPPVDAGRDTVGAYVPTSGAWFLRNQNSPGGASVTAVYGAPGLVPVSGDWNGDGVDTLGVFNPATSVFFLKNSAAGGPADVALNFGPPNAGWVPLAGDWNGDGIDTVGLYNPISGAFFLRNANSPGAADVVFTFGGGGAIPLVGDWNGDGTDTIGLYASTTGAFFLRNANAGGAADVVFTYGAGGAAPIVGDWNGDGVQSIGLYVPATAVFFLRNANSPGLADAVFSYGPTGSVPVAGNWDGM